jgi:predicted GTPase
MPDDPGSRPVPDPTVLTTEQLLREVAAVRDFVLVQLASADRLFHTEVDALRELATQQFLLVERQRVEQKADTKAAVDAALTAQKEAVQEQTAATDKAIQKTETSTGEQLKQLATNFRTEMAGLLVSLGDVKDRLVVLESLRVGAQESRAGLYAAIGAAGALILVVLAVAGFALGHTG